MHDPDVERTTSGSGRVGELTLEQIRSLEVGTLRDRSRSATSVERVPTLDEVLARVPRDKLLIVELKGHPWEPGYDPAEPVARAVAAALSAAGERRTVVSSFNPFSLRALREEAPGLRTAVLTSASFDLASNLAAAVEGRHQECHVPAALLEGAFVELAHASSKRVVAWTVDDPDVVRRFASWGVDGVIGDDPRRALAALRRSS